MLEQIEVKYDLFTSVEEMLAPKTLSELLSKPVTRVNYQPMNGHNGLAGGRLDYVDTDVGRFVLKRMSLEADWIMVSSEDSHCRAVRLWQYGLLDHLLPQLGHPILACAQTDHTWAMLMDDLTGKMYAWDNPVPSRLVPLFLDRLARLHAEFWNDPSLHTDQLGLCDPAGLIDQTSLRTVQKHNHKQLGVLPDWIKGGWLVMEELLDPDVFRQLINLIENPQPLIDALSRYPFTLLHGDYRAENLAYLKPENPIAIDWQNSARSLMTIDLIWFTNWVVAQDGKRHEQAIRYYRGRLETYLCTVFAGAEWQAMVDLGILVDALRSTCFLAYWYKHSDLPQHRRRNKMAVKRRNQKVRDALRWL